MSGVDLKTGAKKIAAPHWPWGPLVVACAAGIVAGLNAPDLPAHKELPEWFVPFFSTSAGVIATLFIALALGSRQIPVSIPMACFTVFYVGLGEVAAVAGLSASLPHSVYHWLLGVTVGAGVGALLTSMIVGAGAISEEVAASYAATVDKMRNAPAKGAPRDKKTG